MAIDPTLIDKLLADYKKPEDILGENGLLKHLTKAVLEGSPGLAEPAVESGLSDRLSGRAVREDPPGRAYPRSGLFMC